MRGWPTAKLIVYAETSDRLFAASGLTGKLSVTAAGRIVVQHSPLRVLLLAAYLDT